MRSAVPRRLGATILAASVAILVSTGSVLACGGLIGPNGAVNLLRTTTFAGYHDGVEHYVTAFEFAGGGGAFGSLIPLPDVPSDVEKGGDWTLQRLIRETSPVRLFDEDFRASPSASAVAEELMKVRIDALDVTVLRGGAEAIGVWAKDHGFRLPPDAPEVLDFYARRSPIFLAAAFDADAAAARGQALGDGTPVHITIPTDDPWVPLRILGLGKQDAERVEADVYLLTDARPNLLPGPSRRSGLRRAHSAPATELLLGDLRSDRDMDWVPRSGWLTKLELDASAAQLDYDLAIDPTGTGTPSRADTGWTLASSTREVPGDPSFGNRVVLAMAVALAGVLLIARLMRFRPRPSA